MATPKHKPTEKLYKLARESGKYGGAWVAFAKRAGIDERTATKYYRDTWLLSKDDEIMRLGEKYAEEVDKALDDAQDVPEKMQVLKAISTYLSKCNPEWSPKQHIEQTNVNIDATPPRFKIKSKKDKEELSRILRKSQVN